MGDESYRFHAGDRVRIKQENPAGNPRTPKHIRGKTGVVVAVHGVIPNPHDHRGLYSPLYTVVFDVDEIFGGSSHDKLRVDVHEEWLELQ
jgi:hypothetical protein